MFLRKAADDNFNGKISQLLNFTPKPFGPKDFGTKTCIQYPW
jgi:hypothetical protein